MQRVELVGMVLGVLLVAVGLAAIYWPVSLIVTGLIVLGACLPDGRKPKRKPVVE